MSVEANPAEGRRLKTWKEIAAFFGCDERTVKRWEETRGLPVRRLPNGSRSAVFAYEPELRAWLNEDRAHHPTGAPQPDTPLPMYVGVARHALWAMAGLGVLALAALFLTWAVWRPSNASSVSAHPPGAEAQRFYEEGLYGWQSRTPAGLTRAVDDFTQAIVRDPQYAEAYAGLADCYNLLRAYTNMPDSYAFPRARAAAQRAIALDPSLADAHAALGFVDIYWTHNMVEGARELREAIRLAPRNATAHHWYAVLLTSLGQFPKALMEIDKARRLDTGSAPILAAKGLILFLSGRTGEAVDLLRQLEEAQPRFASPHLYLADIATERGDDAEFVREFLAYAAGVQHPADQAIGEAAKHGLEAGGHKGMLLAMLSAEQRQFPQGEGSAYAIAQTYVQLGNGGEALRYLELSLRRHESELVALNIDPEFRTLHQLPEFRQLVRQAGVEPRGS